jgi:hypothetical protein
LGSIYRKRVDQGREITVAELSPSDDFSSPLKCQLVYKYLDGRPKYGCLSYVWGKPEFTKAIKLNGKPFFVIENLEVALRHIRQRSQVGALWIDALCINQRDDVERSQQVSLMGEMYQNCEVDLVWLLVPLLGNESSLSASLAKRFQGSPSSASFAKRFQEWL